MYKSDNLLECFFFLWAALTPSITYWMAQSIVISMLSFGQYTSFFYRFFIIGFRNFLIVPPMYPVCTLVVTLIKFLDLPVLIRARCCRFHITGKKTLFKTTVVYSCSAKILRWYTISYFSVTLWQLLIPPLWKKVVLHLFHILCLLLVHDREKVLHYIIKKH